MVAGCATDLAEGGSGNDGGLEGAGERTSRGNSARKHLIRISGLNWTEFLIN